MTEPSAAAREAAQQACAHLRVSRRTRQLTSGHTEGWWECDTGCGERFAPMSLLESVAEARVAEVEGALRGVEWAYGHSGDYCPWCRGLSPTHFDTCRRQRALRVTPGGSHV